MNEIYNIINKITDRNFKDCLKTSFDTFHKMTNEGIRFSEGCVYIMCVYGEMEGYLTHQESDYIKAYIEDKADFDYSRYLEYREKHK